MIKKLSQHLDQVNFTILLSKKGDKIAIAVIPKAKEGDKSLGINHFTACGTADELEAELPALLDKAFNAETIGMISNISQFVNSVNKKVTEVNKAKTTTATTEKAKKEEEKVLADPPPPPPPPKFDPAKLKGAEKKEFDLISSDIEKARKAASENNDLLVNFLEKQIRGKTAKIASQHDLFVTFLDETFSDINNKLNAKKEEKPEDGLFSSGVQSTTIADTDIKPVIDELETTTPIIVEDEPPVDEEPEVQPAVEQPKAQEVIVQPTPEASIPEPTPVAKNTTAPVPNSSFDAVISDNDDEEEEEDEEDPDEDENLNTDETDDSSEDDIDIQIF